MTIIIMSLIKYEIHTGSIYVMLHVMYVSVQTKRLLVRSFLKVSKDMSADHRTTGRLVMSRLNVPLNTL